MRECHDFVVRSLAKLKSLSPSLVVLASSATDYVNGTAAFYDPQTNEAVHSLEGHARLWQLGLNRIVEDLSTSGIPTMILHTIPHFGASDSWLPQTCPALKIFMDDCGITADRRVEANQQQTARDAEERAVAGVVNASTADFTDDLCSRTLCAAQRGTVWLYRDSAHLSVDGSRSLTNRFAELIGVHAT